RGRGRARLAHPCLKCHICGVFGHRTRWRVQRIGFVVAPGFRVMGFAVASVFEFANMERDEPVYDVRLLSETGGPVRSSIGVSVATERFDNTHFDTLIVGRGTEAPTPGVIEF